jgi:hypothetical protein
MEKLNKYDLALAYVSIFFGVTIQWIHTVVYYQLFIEVRRIDSQAVIFFGATDVQFSSWHSELFKLDPLE